MGQLFEELKRRSVFKVAAAYLVVGWVLEVADTIAPMMSLPDTAFWMWSQSLREFRQSEAFRDRVRDSGMLPYWRSHGWPDLCRAVGDDDFECD